MESDNWVVQNLVNALNTWNEKLAEIWQIITQSPENFKGGGDLECDCNDSWRIAGNRICLTGAVLCGGSSKDLREFYGCEEAGTCGKDFYSFCHSKRSSHLWVGADDGAVSDRAGSDQYHYELRRFWSDAGDGSSAGDRDSGRRLRIF